MVNREINIQLAETQEKLRKAIIRAFYLFDEHNLKSFLAEEEHILQHLHTLDNETNNTGDNVFFKNYGYIISSIFHLAKWFAKELKGDPGSLADLKASKINIELLRIESYGQIPDLHTVILELTNAIKGIKSPTEIKSILKKFIQIPFPVIYAFETAPFFKPDRDSAADDEFPSLPPLIVSIEFNINREPWANPHILRPNLLYNINGQVALNYWPEGYDSLVLKPVSTSNNDWFNLSLPPIIYKKGALKYSIDGNIIFKYAQSDIDDALAIKLLAVFQGNSKQALYPTVIGYNQLIAKVLDVNTTAFLSGFTSMNKTVNEILQAISKELPQVDQTDRDNFIKLLSGILNYQGYCAQHGVFKKVASVKESEFRDRMIQHLVGLPYLGEEIIKESSVAGGNIEINYKGIIGELKVETNISDRKELVKKYGKQPISYASGNAKQLSIICILDLTEKNLPPGVPQNNIKWITPKLHGFESEVPAFSSKLVLTIIDGNTKNPSDYSKP